MSIAGHGVISRRAGEPVEVEEIIIEPPGPGEVLVRIQATSVCHTDLHYKLGKISPICWAMKARESSRLWAKRSAHQR